MENFVAYRRISDFDTFREKLSEHGELNGILTSKDEPRTRINGVFRHEILQSETHSAVEIITFESVELDQNDQPLEIGIIDSLNMRDLSIQIRRNRH